jgi:putative membrane protein
MKNISFHNRGILGSLFIIIASIGSASYIMNSGTHQNKALTIELGSMKYTVTDADVKFMAEATEINLEEIRLSEVAQEKSKRVETREMAKKLTTEHYKSLLDLTALAARKNIAIPTKLGDKENVDYEKLNHLAGEALEQEYIEMMIKEHKEAISIYEKEVTGANDPDIRQWVAATLPDARAHLDLAISNRSKRALYKDSIAH